VSAGAWCAEHRAEIERVARGLLRRWSVPAAVTADDVAQELRVGAVLALARYDARRGTDRTRYVWWFALNHAKHWLHAQRGALRHSGHAPSTHALCEAHWSRPFVDCGDAEYWDQGLLDRRTYEGAGADEVAEFAELLRLALAACRTERERACMDALFDARLDVGEATGAVLRDPEKKRICNATSPRHARTLVRRSAQRLMEVTTTWQQ